MGRYHLHPGVPTARSLGAIRAAIIDLDGTMMDTAPDFHVAVARMRAEFGLDALGLPVVAGLIGKGPENMVRKTLAMGLDGDRAEACFEAALASYERHYAAVNGEHAKPYPQVRDGLEEMQRKAIRMVCVTNKPTAMAGALLARAGLARFFAAIHGGDAHPQRKPHPGPLLRVCAELGLAPAQVLVIGDSSNDALAARAAGCPVLTVPYGYNHGQPIEEVDADGIVPTLLDAARLLPFCVSMQQAGA